MHGPALQALIRTLRWQDVVDVFVLTLLSWSAYRWLRRTVAVQGALGLLVLAACSWVATRVGLILTSYLLSAVSAVAAIALVVVFQHELRQGLSRVNPLRWLARHHEADAPLDARMTIARAAFSIAHHRKGALIVIPRGDTITPHVSEGVLIDARLSSRLLEAIFTSTSPLHDGAVVVNHERVLRASVVLPLATAYSLSEALGFEKGISRSFREAPIFLGIFTTLLVIGALVALIPGIPQFKLLLFTQCVNGLLLPVILVAIVLLANNEEIMGEHTNGLYFNVAAWSITVIVSILSFVLIGKSIADMF
jgi:DNA integrity scanning protein DisA with diadenylate cyclase activity